MKQFISEVCDILATGEKLALVTIALQTGSTPRESGAKMAVREDGSILGTVGGGLMEANCIRLGRELLAGNEANAALRTFDLTNEQAAKAAMVCGGRLTVVAERFSGTPDANAPAGQNQDVATLHTIRDLLDKGLSCRLVTEYLWTGGSHVPENHESLRFMQPFRHTITPHDQHARLRDLTADLDCSDTGCLFTEGYTPQPRLFIFGGGHVAKPTANLAHTVGFAVTVLDDRAEFACKERFAESEVRVLADFDHALQGLSVTPNDFLVIMTRGHMHDRTVLEQALATPACYVGMIGSRRKRDALYEVLRKQGMDDATLARCHCPIGLSIQAQTPEEIAVSIVAELIQCRAAKA